ncbi:MAG TPA: hypothetical protein VIV11_40275 [Kofleriaceae bacterium]
MRRLLAAAAGFTAIGAALGLAASPRASTQITVVPPSITVQPSISEVATAQEVAAPVAPMRSSEIALVFSAGGATYMKLADVTAETMPKHHAAKLISADGIETAIARVDESYVANANRAWTRVKVDNTCDASVTGFYIVSRLTGDTGYSGVEDESWTASNVLAHGSAVLAAKLDGCSGTFARDATLPPVIIPEKRTNRELVAKARQAVIASTPARETQTDYFEYDQNQNWWESEHAEFTAQVVKHPTTGVTWVSMHAHMDHGCGDPEVNVWGLFRLEDDGTLAAVQLRKLGDLWSIDQLVDLDNDGELEVIGKPWLGLDTVVVRGSGEELERLSLAFFGCPC